MLRILYEEMLLENESDSQLAGQEFMFNLSMSRYNAWIPNKTNFKIVIEQVALWSCFQLTYISVLQYSSSESLALCWSNLREWRFLYSTFTPSNFNTQNWTENGWSSLLGVYHCLWCRNQSQWFIKRCFCKNAYKEYFETSSLTGDSSLWLSHKEEYVQCWKSPSLFGM